MNEVFGIAVILIVALAISFLAPRVFVWVRGLFRGSPEWHERERMKEVLSLRERIARATVLDLFADGRRDLLTGDMTDFYGHPTSRVLGLRADVQEWLNVYVRSWGRIPYDIQPDKGGAIFIDNQDDALAFKVRWY